MQFICKSLIVYLFAIFCTCETINYKDVVIEFNCPLMKKPIKYDHFEKLASSNESKKYWSKCMLPDFSCAKVTIPRLGPVFSCISDFGEIRPASFHFFNNSGMHKVILDDWISLSKGCTFLGSNVSASTITTVTYRNLTFLAELLCCKGAECSGQRWKKIWDDEEDVFSQFHPRANVFWYTSVSITGTLLSLIILKLTLIAYQRLKERLVIESLKTISRTLKEADDEERTKQKSAILEFFKFRNFRRKKNRKMPSNASTTDVSSQKTNSVQALMKTNKK